MLVVAPNSAMGQKPNKYDIRLGMRSEDCEREVLDQHLQDTTLPIPNAEQSQ